MAGLTSGVFGGSFDPPHIGHLILADMGRASLGLAKVLWVVTADPPHKLKEPPTPIERRWEMVRLAIEDNPHFELSSADIDRPGPHYSLDTMLWLAQQQPEARYCYLMGSDSLRDLPTWREPERFIAACHQLGVMRRPGVDLDLEALHTGLPGLRSKLHFFDAPSVEVSSRDIRRRVREGSPYRYLVPPSVAILISQEGLYL